MGPYWDQEYLLDPDQHFRERQIWNLYDNRWDRYSPVRPGAVDALKANLTQIERIYHRMPGALEGTDPDDVEQVTPHIYRSKFGNASTHFIVSDSGKVLAIDYGYNNGELTVPAKHHLSNRRPLLHGLRGLAKHVGVDRIDTVIPSHFHDDHVNGFAMLRRLFGTRVDNTRVVHAGDQIFFQASDAAPVAYEPGSPLFTNHVYKNGLDLGCYHRVLADLRRFAPQLVLTGHARPYRPDDKWYESIENGANWFDELHRSLMSLGEDEVHFGPESQPAKLYPYRMHLPEGGRADFEGWILNPFPTAERARAVLVGPDDWRSDPIEISLPPREQTEIRISITPPPQCRQRRQPIALDLTVANHPFGQVTEALVTVGHPRF